MNLCGVGAGKSEGKGRGGFGQLPKAESVRFPHKVLDSKYLISSGLMASVIGSQLSLLQHKGQPRALHKQMTIAVFQ